MCISLQSECAPAEENMEPQDRGCWSFGKDEYRGCCDCSRQKDKTCKISNMQCKPGCKFSFLAAGSDKWSFKLTITFLFQFGASVGRHVGALALALAPESARKMSNNVLWLRSDL